MNSTQGGVAPDEQGLVPLLHPGRWPMSVGELHALAVDAFPGSSSRPELWQRFERARRDLSYIARELWVGGSFVSSKLEPKDIDLLAVLRLDRAPPPEGSLEEFLTNTRYILSEKFELDLGVIYEGDTRRGDRWCKWIEYGKPYLRTEATADRGVAVVLVEDPGGLGG